MHRKAGKRTQHVVREFRALRLEAPRRIEHAVGVLLRPDAPQQRLGLQARAVAGRTRRVGTVARQEHAHVHLVSLGFQPAEEARDAVPDARPGFSPAHPLGLAFEHPLALFRSEIAERNVERNAALLRVLLDVVLAVVKAGRLPGPDRAFAQRLRLVRDDKAIVDADHAPEAAASLAGAERRVEGKQARQRLGIVDVAFGAVQVRGVAPRRASRAVRAQRIDVDLALADLERGLDAFDYARFLSRRHLHPILHDLEHRARARVDAVVALRLEQRLDFLFLEVFRHRYRKGEDQARIARGFGTCSELLVYRGRRIAPHGPTAAAAKELSRTREKQLQVVVQLGHRADRRAGRTHWIGLVDGDRRGNPLDRIDLGLVHAVEELARVGTEGLDVAPLPLGVERVENERRLARARDAGDHQQLVQWELEREILEIVLTRAADDDRGAVATVLHGAIVKGVSSGRGGAAFEP